VQRRLSPAAAAEGSQLRPPAVSWALLGPLLLALLLTACPVGQPHPLRQGAPPSTLGAFREVSAQDGDLSCALEVAGPGLPRVWLDARELVACRREPPAPAPGLLHCRVSGLTPGEHRLWAAVPPPGSRPGLRGRGLALAPPRNGERGPALPGLGELPEPGRSAEAWVSLGPEAPAAPVQAAPAVPWDPAPSAALEAFLRGEADAAALFTAFFPPLAADSPRLAGPCGPSATECPPELADAAARELAVALFALAPAQPVVPASWLAGPPGLPLRRLLALRRLHPALGRGTVRVLGARARALVLLSEAPPVAPARAADRAILVLGWEPVARGAAGASAAPWELPLPPALGAGPPMQEPLGGRNLPWKEGLLLLRAPTRGIGLYLTVHR